MQIILKVIIKWITEIIAQHQTITKGVQEYPLLLGVPKFTQHLF